MTVSVDSFKLAMKSVPSPVWLLTVPTEADKTVGCLISGFVSLSICPPSVGVSLMSDSATLSAVRATDSFAVSLLHADDKRTIQRIATAPRESRFDDVPFVNTAGFQVLCNSDLALVCDVGSYHAVQDHTLVVGCVRGVF